MNTNGLNIFGIGITVLVFGEIIRVLTNIYELYIFLIVGMIIMIIGLFILAFTKPKDKNKSQHKGLG